MAVMPGLPRRRGCHLRPYPPAGTRGSRPTPPTRGAQKQCGAVGVWKAGNMRGKAGTLTGSTAAARLSRGRWRVRAKIGLALASVMVLAAAAGLGVARNSAHAGVSNVVGSGFNVTPGDLAFILEQIKIAEEHAATLTPANPCGTLVNHPGDGIPDDLQVPDALTSYGLRTVDGSCNNLLPGREKFAAADVPFPRYAGSPVFR